MSRFSLNFTNSKQNLDIKNITPITFDKNKNFYICSSGGCGSTVIFHYLSLFGNAYHIHDRFPPNKLTYIGKQHTNEEVYNEWFNSVEIPEDKLQNYKVIFIYRNPIHVIFSRYAQKYGPNVEHLKHIKCDNNGNINIYDVLNTGKDLYKMEEFFDNYTINKERNYDIYCIKYELFWDNIALFNKIMDIPDRKELYPVKQENPKKIPFLQKLNIIYYSLIRKMNKMRFFEIIKHTEIKDEEIKDIVEK
jgi:hypothetical protein